MYKDLNKIKTASRIIEILCKILMVLSAVCFLTCVIGLLTSVSYIITKDGIYGETALTIFAKTLKLKRIQLIFLYIGTANFFMINIMFGKFFGTYLNSLRKAEMQFTQSNIDKLSKIGLISMIVSVAYKAFTLYIGTFMGFPKKTFPSLKYLLVIGAILFAVALVAKKKQFEKIT